MIQKNSTRIFEKLKNSIVRITTNNIWIIHLLFFGAYFYVALKETINVPHSLDDIQFFMHQLGSRFLRPGADLYDRLQFFISLGNWPHPKVVGRVFSLISYYGLGEINFRFLLIVGHLFVMLLAWNFVKIFELRFNWESIPIIIIALIPIAQMFSWPVSVLGFVPHVLFASLTYFYISKQKLGWAFVFIFLTTFSSGPGFLVVLPAIVLMGFQKKYWTSGDNWFLVFAFIAVFLIYSEFSLDWRFVRAGGKMANGFSMDYALRVINYGVAFLVNAVRSIYSLNALQLFILGIFSIVGYLFLFINDLKNKRLLSHFTLHGLIFYVMGVSLIAGIVRNNGELFLQLPLPRYNVYSNTFIICIMVLIIKQTSLTRWAMHTKIALLFLTTIHLGFYMVEFRQTFIDQKESLIKNARKMMVNPGRKANKRRIKLSRFVESGLYNAPYSLLNPIVSVEQFPLTINSKYSADTEKVLQVLIDKSRFSLLKVAPSIGVKSYSIVLTDTKQYWLLKDYGKSSLIRTRENVLIDKDEIGELIGQFQVGILIMKKDSTLIMTDQVIDFN